MMLDVTDICCNKCRSIASTSKNEWTRWSASLIAPTEAIRHKTTRTVNEQDFKQDFMPIVTETEQVVGDTVSDQSCGNCGNVLGQGPVQTSCADQSLTDSITYYDKSATCLNSSKSQEYVLPFIGDNGHENMPLFAKSSLPGEEGQEKSPLVNGSVRAASQSSLQPVAGPQEAAGTALSRLEQQDIDIKKLSKSLDTLHDRMLALEKSMLDVRKELRASKHGSGREQDMFIDSFDNMLGALGEIRSAGRTMVDLTSENEELQRTLHVSRAPTASDGDDDPLRTAANTAMGAPCTAPLASFKKKRSYNRRKPLTAPGSVTQAAPHTTDVDSNFASSPHQDDPSQLGGLEALKVISSAMAQATSTGLLQKSNAEHSHRLDSHQGETVATNVSITNPALSMGNDLSMSQQQKRRRIHETAIDRIGTRCTKKATYTTDLPPTSSHPSEGPQTEPRVTAAPLTLQACETHPSIAMQIQDAAMSCDIQGMDDDMVIDPALRSASVSANQTGPLPDGLSLIEIPPDQRPKTECTQQEKTNGFQQYNTDHEARIREYKARDALRKRTARAISTNKKKSTNEDIFKEQEKIKARDRMVKELMEREEMLGNECDF